MSEEVTVLGVHSTVFGRWPDRTFKDLTREAYLGALRDAGLDSGKDIAGAWFGSCMMAHWGQPILGGNTCFIPLVREGLFPDRAPIVNVEGACATGSLALAGAYKEIKAGDAELTLAIGVEKLYDPSAPKQIFRQFGSGMDFFDPGEWTSHYVDVGRHVGKSFEPGGDRSIAMDTYAMQALLHSQQHGTTVEQIAHAAAKNHSHGSLNPRAQYRFAMTTAEVLTDRVVSHPLTRSMCAPIGDGAAAALLCSRSYLDRLPARARERAVHIRGFGLSGGKYRAYDEPGLSQKAADRAYEMAGVGPEDVHVAEVHDATAFCEIYQCEMLRFCPPGGGGELVASGATTLGGRLPVNTSGGLVSKGHPVGATGLSMCYELVTQLRGEAGARQVPGATLGLQENGGGIIGLEEALAAVVIYQRAR